MKSHSARIREKLKKMRDERAKKMKDLSYFFPNSVP
jgi:hypothetical protein